MSTREKLITARLGMLALVEELNNISKACKVASVSRSHYYEIKKAYETYGREGLAPKERRKPRMPNQTSPEIEAQILEMTERYPTYSYIRISHQLRLSGVPDSIASVRYVWQRHGLARRMQRLLWMEKRGLESGRVLTEELKRLLARYKRRDEKGPLPPDRQLLRKAFPAEVTPGPGPAHFSIAPMSPIAPRGRASPSWSVLSIRNVFVSRWTVM